MQSLEWRYIEHDGVANHQRLYCLLNRLFGHRSKKISKLCVTGLCAGNSPVTGEFPTQRASDAENVSIWWRHHVPAGISISLISGASVWMQFSSWLQLGCWSVQHAAKNRISDKCVWSRVQTVYETLHIHQVSGEFPTQRASNTENVSIWWRHRVPAGISISLISWASV